MALLLDTDIINMYASTNLSECLSKTINKDIFDKNNDIDVNNDIYVNNEYNSKTTIESRYNNIFDNYNKLKAHNKINKKNNNEIIDEYRRKNILDKPNESIKYHDIDVKDENNSDENNSDETINKPKNYNICIDDATIRRSVRISKIIKKKENDFKSKYYFKSYYVTDNNNKLKKKYGLYTRVKKYENEISRLNIMNRSKETGRYEKSFINWISITELQRRLYDEE